MALMEALLQIKAAVSGGDAIDKLGRSLGGLNSTAGQVSNGLKGLMNASGGLGGVLGNLVPLLSGAGVMAMAKGAIDAADNMRDLSQKTGVTVERLSQFKTAAEMSGTTIESVGGALIKLGKNMAASAEAGIGATANAIQGGTTRVGLSIKDQVALIEKGQEQQISAIKSGAERQVAEVKSREERQLNEIRIRQERATDAVRTGEQRQIDAINRAAEQRLTTIQGESESRLRELNRRYRQEEKLLNDSYDDQRDRLQEAADDEQRIIERGIERRYSAMEKAVNDDKTLSDDAREQALQRLRDQQEAELEAVNDRFKAEGKARDRALRDQQELEQQAIEDRKLRDEQAEKTKTDTIKDGIRTRAEAEKNAVKQRADAQAAEIKRAADLERKAAQESAKLQADAIKAATDAKIIAIKDGSKAAADAFKLLGIELKNQDGSLRNSGDVLMDIADKFKAMPDGVNKTAIALKLFGKAGADMIPLLNMGGEEIKKLGITMTSDFADAADNFNDKLPVINASLTKLGVGIAQTLLPVINVLADVVTGLATVLSSLPTPVQQLIGLVTTLAIALPTISAVLGFIASLQIGATIAGWLGAVGPFITGTVALLTGLMAWMIGTLLPFLVGIFSGPVGWTVLAIAAITAMCIAFREPLGQFLQWLGQLFMGIPEWFNTTIVQPLVSGWQLFTDASKSTLDSWIAFFRDSWIAVVSWWQGNIVQPIGTLWNGLVQGIQGAMQATISWVFSAWNGLVNGLRGLANAFLSGWVNAINGVIRGVNSLIAAFNNLPGPDIGYVPTVPLPGFADGGYVDRPMIAQVGEGGQPEYIVPANRMAAASAAYLSGARGTKVLSSTAAAPQPAGPVRIDIKTGPVMRTADGQDWVTVDDLERAMRLTADGVFARLRTPAARIALGRR